MSSFSVSGLDLNPSLATSSNTFRRSLRTVVSVSYTHLDVYKRQPEELQEVFLTQVLGCSQVLSAGTQKESFQAIIEETLGDDCSYETVKTIHENLSEMLEEHKDAPEPLVPVSYTHLR